MISLQTRAASMGLGAVLTLAACSEQPRKGPPTEQEIHANDSAVAGGMPGRHPYRCDDKQTLLVDFKDEGLTVELRREAQAAPVVLTAPTQGLQYVGETASATFSGSQIKIEEAGKRSLVCRKETRL